MIKMKSNDSNVIDEEEMMRQLAEYEALMEDVNDRSAPSPVEKDSQYKLIREIINLKDSRKVANLTHEELGRSDMSLRGCLKTALLCDTLGIISLGDCYREEAEIIAGTSMSRYVKGSNLLNLIFTQIKKTIMGSSEPKQQKKGMFNFRSRNPQYGGAEE